MYAYPSNNSLYWGLAAKIVQNRLHAQHEMDLMTSCARVALSLSKP